MAFSARNGRHGAKGYRVNGFFRQYQRCVPLFVINFGHFEPMRPTSAFNGSFDYSVAESAESAFDSIPVSDIYAAMIGHIQNKPLDFGQG